MPGHDHDVNDTASEAPRRRDFLRYSGGVAAAGGIAGALAGTGILAPASAGAATGRAAAAAPSPGLAAATGNLAASPIRPPAAPLAVRGPYLSTHLGPALCEVRAQPAPDLGRVQAPAPGVVSRQLTPAGRLSAMSILGAADRAQCVPPCDLAGIRGRR
jgi:hypothetical protein